MRTYLAQSSGHIAASAVIVAGPCRLHGFYVHNENAAAQTSILYDNATAASGLILAERVVPSDADRSVQFTTPVVCTNGIYATVGADSECIIYYSRM